MAAAFATVVGPGVMAGDSPLAMLAGSWSGSGHVLLDGGSRERLSCRAYYTARDAGAVLGMAVRCASQSYTIELRSTLHYEGGRVTGAWEERTFNAAGSLSGRATSGNIDVKISGGVSGTLSLAYGASRQLLSITTENSTLRGVSVLLTRG